MKDHDQSQTENDTLWPFIEDCYQNCKTFHEENADLFALYDDIDGLFRDARAVSCNKTTELLLPMFLGRAHAAYLGAFCLAVSGLVPECFMLIRGCIENALYALYVQRKPSMQQIWFDREKGADGRSLCRNSFAFGKVSETLRNEDPVLWADVDALYNESIDCGAHPNVVGHLATSQVTDRGCNVSLLDPTSAHWKRSLRVIAQAGVYGLRVFALVYGNRFQEAGISVPLNRYPRQR